MIYELSDDLTVKNRTIEMMKSKIDEIKELTPLILLRVSMKVNEMRPSIAKSILTNELMPS